MPVVAHRGDRVGTGGADQALIRPALASMQRPGVLAAGSGVGESEHDGRALGPGRRHRSGAAHLYGPRQIGGAGQVGVPAAVEGLILGADLNRVLVVEQVAGDHGGSRKSEEQWPGASHAALRARCYDVAWPASVVGVLRY